VVALILSVVARVPGIKVQVFQVLPSTEGNNLAGFQNRGSCNRSRRRRSYVEHFTHRNFCGSINIKCGSWGAWWESQALPSTEGNHSSSSQNRGYCNQSRGRGNQIEHFIHRTFSGCTNIKRGSWGAWCESQALPSTEGNNSTSSQNRGN
jgi:hypothetical protein